MITRAGIGTVLTGVAPLAVAPLAVAAMAARALAGVGNGLETVAADTSSKSASAARRGRPQD